MTEPFTSPPLPPVGEEDDPLKVLRKIVVAYQQGTKPNGTGQFSRGEISGVQGTLAVMLTEIDKLAAQTRQQHTEQLAAKDREIAEQRANYEGACQTIAAMHAAAVGEVTGPKLGVVEDVAALRAELAQAQIRGDVRVNMLRYIAFVTTGDEQGDGQLGVDRLKAEIETLKAMSSDREHAERERAEAAESREAALREEVDRLSRGRETLVTEVDTLMGEAEAAQDREAALRAELEVERMRLAGCGVAAMGNTPATVAQRIGRDSPYWSASYGDVCAAVDREMALRAELEQANAHIAVCEQTIREQGEFGGLFQHGGRFYARASLPLGRSAVVEGGKWLVVQLEAAEALIETLKQEKAQPMSPLSRPGDDFRVIGSGYEAGFNAGYTKGYADGLDESAGDPRVERIEAGFKAMHEATNGEYSREDMIVMDALQAGREFSVRLARRETHIEQLIGERGAFERLVVELQTHAKEHNWQDVDAPIAALLALPLHQEPSQ